MLALLDRTALRVVLAVGFATSAVVAIASCGAASEGASSFGGNGDGGNEDGGTGGDGGSFDAGVVPPFVMAVHASPDLEDFRICFGTSDTPAATTVRQDAVFPVPDNSYGPMPESNYPGISVGGGVALRPFTHGADVVPYVIRASDLTRPGYDTLTCDQLICTTSTTCLHDGEFWKLDAFERSGLHDNHRYVLAIVGCRSGGAGACTVAGALGAHMFEVASIAEPVAGTLSGQILHLAPAIGAVTVSVGDAGESLAAYEAIAPSAGVVALPAPPRGNLAAYANESFHLDYGDAGADFSLALVQRLSDPSMLPTDFFERNTPWVFVVLGDPAAPPPVVDGGINPSYDGRGLHLLALPTTPPARDGG